MSKHFRDIDHPLRRGGLSRPERDLAALATDTAPLDGRSLGDLLRFWYDYARQVNYYGLSEDRKQMNISGDWLDFFRRSHPFQYANIGAYDLESLDARFQEINDGIETRRTFASLNPLLDLLLEMAGLLADWQTDLRGDQAGLLAVVEGLIETSLREPVRTLAGLVNGAAKWGYQSGVPLSAFRDSYGLSLTDTFAADRSISGRRGSTKHKVLAGRDALADTYRLLWKALEAAVTTARDDERIEDSLRQPLTADTPPHLGLVFSFLLLYREAQEGLNRLSDDHLDFFYRDTLRLREIPLVEDRAHLIFELGKRVEESVVVEKGRRFKAGKDAAGTEIIFATEEDLILTKTTIAATKTLFLDPAGISNGQLYAAPLAASGDGLGGDFPKETPPAWPSLGAATATYPDPETEITAALPPAKLGLMLASPVLLLREGTRTVTVTITLGPDAGTEALGNIPDVVANNLFEPYFSTEEGWTAAPAPSVSATTDAAARTVALELVFTLSPEFVAIAHPGAETLPFGIPQELPALRLDFKEDIADRLDWYCRLGQLPVMDVVINVDVFGVRELRLENDFSPLDPTKAFLPFGSQPRANAANFYVGSEEVVAKRWTSLTLTPEWLDLPDFTNYYDCYESEADWAPENIGAVISARFPAAPAATLFPLLTTAGEGTSVVLVKSAEADTCSWPGQLPADLSAADCGIFHFRLGTQDFLHAEYPQAILTLTAKNENIAQENAMNELAHETALLAYQQRVDRDPETAGPVPEPTEAEELVVLRAPYTPAFSGISMSYLATDRLEQDLRIAHLHPWETTYEWQDKDTSAGSIVAADAGATEENQEANFPLLPTFPGEGHLFLGLENYQAGEALNLYFELDPATADPRLEKAPVQWAYLRGNEWCYLENETQVLTDTTVGLIQPGIVQIAPPSDMSREGTTILPPAYHWLRASVAERSAAIAATLKVSTQAAVVVAATTDEHDPQRLTTALPAGSIAKILAPLGDLKAIDQPFPSFGGQAPEAREQFNRRVSELLRHKGRAITLNDYERIILEAFPRVYRVKCLTHTLGVRGNAGEDLELAPGHITLVVVPDLTQVNAVNPYEPRLPAAELEAIRTFLLDKVSPGASLHVLNPEYEEVRLSLCVRFGAGRSTAFYRRRLQRDLRGLLAPWTLATAGADITFGGRFYYSSAVRFVEELDYVDYVKDLSIDHPTEGVGARFQAAVHARSVLTTANGPVLTPSSRNNHHITVIEA